MQMKCNNKVLSWIICMVLMIAIALGTTGCSDGKENTKESGYEGEKTESQNSELQDRIPADIITVGEGETSFLFFAFDKEGNVTKYEVYTNQTIVGEALQEVGLVDGTDETYGLYVRTVNGITLDFNEDGYYWAFYVEGEYAMKGVDQTEITPGSSYSFKAEK